MDVVGAIASIALGIVFVVAGASKLAAGRRWPADAAGLGVIHQIAVVVPWFELGVGAACIVRLAMPVPPLVALALLVVMTTLILRRLVDGDHPPCACFGAWSSRPLGAGHVARNVLFAAVAVVAVVGG